MPWNLFYKMIHVTCLDYVATEKKNGTQENVTYQIFPNLPWVIGLFKAVSKLS